MKTLLKKGLGLSYIILSVGLCFTALKVEAVEEYSWVKTFGVTGVISSAPGYVYGPMGVDVDSAGNVYVAEAFNIRVQKFNSSGQSVLMWGGATVFSGGNDSPRGIAVDSAGNVYTADTNYSRILKFDSNGNLIATWGGTSPQNIWFEYPHGVAVDSLDNVYVADTGANRIKKYSSSGVLITQWGGKGSASGKFNNPMGVAVDSVGNVYVADQNNRRIQKFDSNGGFITKWGGDPTDGDGNFNYPTGVAVDSDGNVYVADTYNDRIQKFDSNGGFITKWGSSGNGNAQFNFPWGITVDSAGNVYVGDLNNHRIQKFAPKFPPVANCKVGLNMDDLLILDGSGSSDSDGTIVAYEWSIDEEVIGTTAIVGTEDLEPGIYEATLTVTDNDGATDSCTVNLVKPLGKDPQLEACFDALDLLLGPIDCTATNLGLDVIYVAPGTLSNQQGLSRNPNALKAVLLP